MAYSPITPSACIWLISSTVLFTNPLSTKLRNHQSSKPRKEAEAQPQPQMIDFAGEGARATIEHYAALPVLLASLPSSDLSPLTLILICFGLASAFLAS